MAVPSDLVGRLRAVCAGPASVITSPRAGDGRSVNTAFLKLPIEGEIEIGVLGIAGDEHVYHDHGGPDMALLMYSHDHYAYWRSLGIELPQNGAFGENLTVEGLVETDVQLGDVFRIGSCLVQICQPRSPCHKLATRFGRKDMPVLMQNTGYTGYLLRVVEPGRVRANDLIDLVERRDDSMTVAEASRILNVDRGDLDDARRMLAVAALGSSARRKLEQRIARGGESGLDTERLFDA